MKTMDRETLRKTLERGQDVHCVMVMSEQHYELAHIPGSETIASWASQEPKPGQGGPIIVYCTNEYSHASFQALRALEKLGFEVYRYAGGLEDWDEAGFPLQGKLFEGQ